MGRARAGTFMAAVLVTTVVVHEARTSRDTIAVDFYQFWAVPALRARLGPTGFDPWTWKDLRPGAEVLFEAAVEDAQGRDEARGRSGPPPLTPWLRAARERPALETVSTPFLYVTASALLGGDYEADHARFCALWALALLAGLFGLGAVLRLPAARVAPLYVLAAIFFDPLRSDRWVGNVSPFQVAALAAVVALASRRDPRFEAAAGALLGALVALKPTLAPAAAALAAARLVRGERGRLLHLAVGAAVGLFAALASTVLVFDLGAWGRWLTILADMPDTWIAASSGNVSLVRHVRDGPGVDLAPWLWAGALILSCAVLLRWAAHDRARRDEARDLVAILGLGVCALLLASPLVWKHYLTLVLPLLLGPLLLPGPAHRAPVALLALLAAGPGPLREPFGLESSDAPRAWLAAALTLALQVDQLVRPASVAPPRSAERTPT